MLNERIMQPNTLSNLWNSLNSKYSEREAVQRFYSNVSAEVQRAGDYLMESSARAWKGQVQELTTPSDHPAEVYGNNVGNFVRSAAVDLGFKEVFDVLDFTGTRASGFDVNVYNDNATVGVVEPGENMKIYAVTTSDSHTRFLKYGGGIAWAREWIEDEKFYMFDDANRQLLNQALRAYSNLGYSVIETNAQTNVTYATTPTSGSQAMLDAETIWDAARVIIQNVEDQLQVSMDLQTAQFSLISPLESVRRNLTALAITPDNTGLVGGPMIAKPNIRLVPTNRLTTTSRLGLLCLAGFEMKWGDRQNNQVRNEFSTVKDSEVVTVTWRANGVKGNANQVEVVPSS